MATLRLAGVALCSAGLLAAVACGDTSSGPDTSTPKGGESLGGVAQAGSAGAAVTSAGSGSTTAGSSSGGVTNQAGSGGVAAGTGGDVQGMAGEGGAAGAPNLARPNIVVVLVDDMGYSDLGAYGGEIRTPSIDQLAAKGTRFRNFHVTPRCSPTRIALLTGLYTQQAATMPGASLPPLRTDNNVTLPEMLSTAGYRTFMAGKWHIGTDDAQIPRRRGFQHVFGFGPKQAGAEANKWIKTEYSFSSQGNAIPERQYGDTPGDFYQARAMGDYALDYLSYHEAQKDDAPFFMYLAFNAPHFPVQAPRDLVENAPAAGGKSYLEMYGIGWGQMRKARYDNMLKAGVIDASFGLSPTEPFGAPEQTIPGWATLGATQQADLTRKMGLYAASIESVDTAVGRVVAHLKASGSFDNTIIFVLSDNGGNWEGGPVGTSFGKPAALTGAQLQNMGQANQADDHMQVGGGWANVETTPFRFYKHYTHGGGVRSPLIVSWPANTKSPGGWTNQFAHVIDLAPTILEAARVTHPANFGGHDTLPLEGNELLHTIADGSAPFPRQLGFEHETNRAWLDGNFKLVVRHENADAVELYDLSIDPSELHDLSAAQPARTAKMVHAWNQWASRVGVPTARLLPEN